MPLTKIPNKEVRKRKFCKKVDALKRRISLIKKIVDRKTFFFLLAAG